MVADSDCGAGLCADEYAAQLVVLVLMVVSESDDWLVCSV